MVLFLTTHYSLPTTHRSPLYLSLAKYGEPSGMVMLVCGGAGSAGGGAGMP